MMLYTLLCRREIISALCHCCGHYCITIDMSDYLHLHAHTHVHTHHIHIDMCLFHVHTRGVTEPPSINGAPWLAKIMHRASSKNRFKGIIREHPDRAAARESERALSTHSVIIEPCKLHEYMQLAQSRPLCSAKSIQAGARVRERRGGRRK